MEILRDKHVKPEGIFREIAGAHERLYDRAGRPSGLADVSKAAKGRQHHAS